MPNIIWPTAKKSDKKWFYRVSNNILIFFEQTQHFYWFYKFHLSPDKTSYCFLQIKLETTDFILLIFFKILTVCYYTINLSEQHVKMWTYVYSFIVTLVLMAHVYMIFNHFFFISNAIYKRENLCLPPYGFYGLYVLHFTT